MVTRLEIPILTFHSLDRGSSPLSFPASLFRRGMAHLHRAGFRAVSVGRAARLLQGDDGGSPERLVAITFDDGCQSFYEHAFPVLRDLGYQATVFVITAPDGSASLPFMDGRPRMTWDQLGRLHESGMEIGSHTVTHPDLTRLDEAGIAAEFEGSRTAIAERAGAPAVSLAYPFGFYNDVVRNAARARFDCACTADLGVAGSGSDPHTLSRLEMHCFRHESTFRLLTSPRLAQYVAVRGALRAVRRRLRR